MLAAMKGIVLSSPPLPRHGGEVQGYCPDPQGRDVLTTLEAALRLRCAECKKHSMIAARRAIDAGARHVELCMTVTDDPEEHVFLRIDGRFKDPAVEAGMPVRRIGDFIAETVWRAPPDA